MERTVLRHGPEVMDFGSEHKELLFFVFLHELVFLVDLGEQILHLVVDERLRARYLDHRNLDRREVPLQDVRDFQILQIAVLQLSFAAENRQALALITIDHLIWCVDLGIAATRKLRLRLYLFSCTILVVPELALARFSSVLGRL